MTHGFSYFRPIVRRRRRASHHPIRVIRRGLDQPQGGCQLQTDPSHRHGVDLAALVVEIEAADHGPRNRAVEADVGVRRCECLLIVALGGVRDHAPRSGHGAKATMGDLGKEQFHVLPRVRSRSERPPRSCVDSEKTPIDTGSPAGAILRRSAFSPNRHRIRERFAEPFVCWCEMTKSPPRTPPPPPPHAPTGPTDPSGSDRIVVPLHSAQSIVGLQICGTARFLPLPAKNVMRLGRGDVEIPIPDDVVDRDLITREHAQLTRQGTDNGTWLHVVDLGSRYGTFFGKGREREFFVKAGQRFRVANTELMVMDRLLTELRRELGGFFGYAAHDVLDEHTPTLGADVPVLLVGDRGTERGHLARAIHHNSQRRGNGFEEVKVPTASREALTPIFRKADRGTVYVSLDQIGPRTGLSRLVELMFDGTYDVRPIIAARDHRVVCDALSTVMPRFSSVTVPPVSTHREDVPAILDAMLKERGSPHRTAELAADRRAAMCNYEWPRNRTELRETAERIAALLAHGGNKVAAAASLKQDPEWFRRSLAKVGAIEVKRRGE